MLLISEYIIHWISPSAEITLLAGRYLLVMIPGAFGRFINQVLNRFCEAQNVALPSLLVNFSSCVAVVLLCILLVSSPLALGGLGAAMAISACSVALPFLTLTIMLKKPELRETRFCRVRWTYVLDLPTLRLVSLLAFLSIINVFVSWFSEEIGQLLSGRLGVIELGAQTVLNNFTIIFHCVPYGLGNLIIVLPQSIVMGFN